MKPIYDSYIIYKENDYSTISVLSKVHGYKGEDDIDSKLDYMEQLPENKLNSVEKDIVSRARYFRTDPEVKIVLKKGSMVVIALFIFYLIVEYALTRTYSY
ncbi:hypothetical protein [Facklamia sp. 7083-14-GEN3]|uniref:hypothetical protein n=1 Tax=Facklamia sp. 7083-14-GEN3 TaxID=2973478 RepID=UPI00215C69A8|nr:hypothetical protein [Facklamia sp. 7083-14-GEN3]MCR8969207.1 hypothetical protein [Facklamia sp. 7083-14-GEN3]